MTEHFADRLSRLIDERGPICAGLDPRKNQMPKNTTVIVWARGVIRALQDQVAVFKPQTAFWDDDWEMVGNLFAGGQAGHAMVLVDCKRGDIGSTAKAYAETILSRSWVDAITVNPYLGQDSLEPFVEAAEKYNKGIFVLVQTSNPGAKDLQKCVTSDGLSISQHVANMVFRLGNDLPSSKTARTRVGAVIGFTVDSMDIKVLRQYMPNAFFLMPGYGVQGGDPACLSAAYDSRGGGVLVSASRSLTLPWGHNIPETPDEVTQQIMAAHEAMKADLRQTS